jgi:hypothetical protein
VSANRIHQWLDQAGLPWRSSRAELVRRFGITHGPWSHWDEVFLAIDLPPFPDLIMPLSFRCDDRAHPDQPPLSLSGYLHRGKSAETHLQDAHDAVAGILGPGTYEDISVNARSWVWRDGAASLKLTAFPPRLQKFGGENEWHAREPRLKTACSISIETGYLPPCSPEEVAWISAAVPGFDLKAPDFAKVARVWRPRPPAPEQPGWLARLFGAKPPEPPPLPPQPALPTVEDWLAGLPPSFLTLHYHRLPPAGIGRLYGQAVRSPDGQHILLCKGPLLVIPVADIRCVRLSVYPYERSPGCESILELVCAPATPEGPPCMVQIDGADGANTLDAFAADLARWIDVPLERND